MSTIPVHSSFEVSSDALCFGSRREVKVGASHPFQVPTCASFDTAGTVLIHQYKYNFQALRGRWDVYMLQESGFGGRITAAMACHSSIQHPFEEATRILQVANSPYEEDHATNRNTQKTWDGRVLVVNRYDWGEDYYGEAEDGITVGEETLMGDGQRNSRWLVDYAQVMETMENSDDDVEEDWVYSGRGVRLVIFGEYIFGRFGLTEDHSAVQSFLMFSADTQLSKCCLQNDPTPNRFVYVPLTPEQRHSEKLADGSYLGYEWLRRSTADPEFFQNLVPPLGVESMIPLSEIQSILQRVNPKVTGIVEPQLQPEVLQLLNETMGVWIQSLGNKAETIESKDDLLKAALPNAYGPNQKHIHAQILKKFNNSDCTPLTTDSDMVHKVVPAGSKVWRFLTMDQVGRGMMYLLEEILELAGNCALDNGRNMLVPSDIRIAIINDEQFCEENLNRSQVFWPPDMVVTGQ
eukprot:scaffold9307_cov166-Amphora_coffeaeformis.AAC.3